MDLYGISLLLKCANISAQRLSTGPQNLIYALIGGGWGSGLKYLKYSNVLASCIGGGAKNDALIRRL